METNIFYENGKKYNCRVNGKPYYRATATIDGKRRQVYGDGYKDAQKKLEAMRDKAKLGFNLDKQADKVGYVLKHWIYNVKRVEVKASSFTRYESTYRNHMLPYSICSMALSKVDSATMQAYVNDLYDKENYPAATIRETIKVWRMFYIWALEEGYIVKIPTRNLSLPERTKGRKKIIEIFTPEERVKIANYMGRTGYMYKEIITLAFATGMRQGELLALKWEDIYDDAIHVSRSTAMVTHVDSEGNRELSREVWDTKTTNSIRTIPLTAFASQMLKDVKLKQMKYLFSRGLPQSEYVFTSSTGDLIDARTFIRSYARMLERAGVPYRKFHTIRHTFATEAIRRGVDVKDLQLLMGHSDIEITYIYVQSDEESRRNAIDKIGNII